MCLSEIHKHCIQQLSAKNGLGPVKEFVLVPSNSSLKVDKKNYVMYSFAPKVMILFGFSELEK